MKTKISKLFLPFTSFLILIICSVSSDAAPVYFYPKQYTVTLKNANKNEINNIELLYFSRMGFNYGANDNCDLRTKDTIAKLSESKIDAIAFSRIHQDTSKIKGYWIEQSIIDMHTCIAKFAIYENSTVKYYPNKITVSYSGDKSKKTSPDGMILRITKKDNSVIYSAPIYSAKYEIIDEFSTRAQIIKAKSLQNTHAYFEADFSEIKNKFAFTEVK